MFVVVIGFFIRKEYIPLTSGSYGRRTAGRPAGFIQPRRTTARPLTVQIYYIFPVLLYVRMYVAISLFKLLFRSFGKLFTNIFHQRFFSWEVFII